MGKSFFVIMQSDLCFHKKEVASYESEAKDSHNCKQAAFYRLLGFHTSNHRSESNTLCPSRTVRGFSLLLWRPFL